MNDLILYLGMTIAGYALGARMRRSGMRPSWASGMLGAVIMLVVFAMGLRIGANQDVVSNLNLIGLYALITVLSALLFTIVGLALLRRALKLDRHGMLADSESLESTLRQPQAIPADDGSAAGINPATIRIVCSVAGGVAIGWTCSTFAHVPFGTLNGYAGVAIRVGLCVLLVLIGLDLGLEGTVIRNIRNAGLRVLAVPFVAVAATLAALAVCSIFLPLSLRECLAIGAGFGWYSLAPGIIMDQGYITAGAVSFMHNILRELLSIITIPLVARHVGYIESTGLAGAAAMDVCLPVVEQSTNGITTVYAFVSGVVLSVLVPVLVPLFI
ncbi:lysine exporter LysO family protein [Slackia heliotrinireducens]|uniref:lysine exporter LysO family protein n=1 Tax=Slackia heliotrinireducens TaxID=84110 RepID=UPI0033155077